MRTIIFKPKARADLDNIWRYSYERWSDQQADAYYAAITEAMKSLLLDDKLGSPVSIIADYRKLPSGSHVIYYRPIPNGIEIIRVLHQSMDIGRHL